ncbi:DUF4252 domain-containing protein [Echinicola jeungdonensis]|uniref:DUF4252 domain-containing protein n=1 Tax=Echinicola jeungdonensis TaxID=709343 RepID=A0ABV5J4L7_9BACT|nr:DUF4252 domain-containing protein [Echinicola jeungdonensis]MDN3668732.1 DUF4252 domain-containing protein [Echinicola jeungdonensis]
MMKKGILIIALVGLVGIAYGQSNSVGDLFTKYKGEKDFFHLDLSGNFLDFTKGVNIDMGKEDLDDLMKSVDGIKLFKLPVNGKEAKEDFKSLRKGLKKEKYELMMEFSEKGNEVAIYSIDDQVVRDLVLLIGGDDGGEYLVVELQGEFESKALIKAMQ